MTGEPITVLSDQESWELLQSQALGRLTRAGHERGVEGLVDEHGRDPIDAQLRAPDRELDHSTADDQGAIFEERDLDHR